MPGSVSASAANTGGRGPPSMRSIGSTPVPSDLDIRRPSGAWMTDVMSTSVNGTSPVNSIPIMIIRATHRLMISRAVTSASVG